jgi:CDP-6-deoxy-D-xylo-4-hexulose-3-dehydrase
MGAMYNGKHTGTIGLAGSFSFFCSHHIQTMEGGMVLCQDKDDADYMRSLRAHGWVRDLPADSPLYKKTGHAFDDNFIFATPGYNVRPLEMSGAIGSEQLKKWPQIEATRINNAKHFVDLFRDKPFLRIQQIVGESSWFTFGIVLDGELKGRRAEIVKALDEAGIQNRPLASRNFLKQPVMRELDYIASGEMTAADDIHDNGFFVGNGSKDIRDELDQLYITIAKFIK